MRTLCVTRGYASFTVQGVTSLSGIPTRSRDSFTFRNVYCLVRWRKSIILLGEMPPKRLSVRFRPAYLNRISANPLLFKLFHRKTNAKHIFYSLMMFYLLHIPKECSPSCCKHIWKYYHDEIVRTVWTSKQMSDTRKIHLMIIIDINDFYLRTHILMKSIS